MNTVGFSKRKFVDVSRRAIPILIHSLQQNKKQAYSSKTTKSIIPTTTAPDANIKIIKATRITAVKINIV